MINQTGVNQYLEILDKPYFWRLFVDGIRQSKTTEFVEFFQNYNEADLGHFFWARREPNGINKLKITAQKLLQEDISHDLTFDFISSVHKSAYPFSDYLRVTTGYLTTGDRSFGDFRSIQEAKWINKRSLAIKNKYNLDKAPWGIAANNNGTLLPYEVFSDIPHQEKLETYKKLLDDYNRDIDLAESNESKLPIIAQFMQDLECLHFFSDGNCRMVYLLLNKELLKHGLNPVVLHNPNYLDTFLPENLVKEIQLGQDFFNNLYENGLINTNCVSNEDIANNLSKLDLENFALKGGDGFTYEEALSFSKTALEIFDCLQSNIKDSEHLVLHIMTNLMIYECAKKQYSTYTKDKTYSKFFSSQKKLIKDLSVIAFKEPEKFVEIAGDKANSFVELLNFNTINEYIQNNLPHRPTNGRNAIKKYNKKLPEKQLNLIKKYLEELRDLAQKYVEGYSVESLTNPETCHLTIVELDALKVDNKISTEVNLLVIEQEDSSDIPPIGKTIEPGEITDLI